MGDSFWPTGFVLSLHCSTISEERYVGEDFSACPRQIRPACASQVPREGAVRDTSRDALRALSSPSTCVASRKFLARRLPRAPRPRHWRPRAALRWRSRRCVSPRHQLPDPWNWLCPPGDVFSPRARLRRASRRPPGFDRAEFASDCCRECSGRESERTRRRARSAHEDSTRGSPPISWGNAAFRKGDLVRAFAATTGSHRDQGAGAPAHRAARFLPRGSLALCAQDSSRSRLEDAVLARGIPSRPLNGLATRASPRSAQLFSPVPRLPELATDRHSDRPSLSIRRFVVSPLFPATIPPRAISNTPRVSSSRSSRLSRRGRISSTTTTFSSRCVPRARPDRRQIPPNPPRRTRLEPCR